MLHHLKVLDLTDHRGLACGRLLADLGADVVQVEPQGGSTARSATPLDTRGRSMFWETFSANKRGIALDTSAPDGARCLDALLEVADIVVTSMPVPDLERLGLHPERTTAAHPELVHVAITPFGLTGPKSRYLDSDLVIWAAGGPLDPHRDGDLPPLRISVEQAYLHAATDAAAGALLAHRVRGADGRGQVVDVSAQASLGVATLGRVLAHTAGDAKPQWHQQPTFKAAKPAPERVDQSGSGASTSSALKKWHCTDGIVELHLAMGPASGGFTNNFIRWMHDEGACADYLLGWDWRTVPALIESGEISEDDITEVRRLTAEFLGSKTKSQVQEAAVRYRLLCIGISDMSDIAASPQLSHRGFFAETGSGADQVRLPARWVHVSGGADPDVRRPAPSIGQHTAEVLESWLGADDPALSELSTSEVLA
ncbi:MULTISPECIES: CoA transferase [Rhodococcus]|uniref:CoA transferase n=1 Tax=Rhodococcus globerulus TaxID=33008 RepID=UPI001C58B166|nr:CoA transferase [Rhodococcus globerulus]QXV99944.1 CoA transferase [Rhodococcus globerulus]